MLTRLALRDFAIVSLAEISFAAGMTVVSGETGAGKSLLVDALLWLTGARADAGIVRHGAQRAELDAEFSLDDAPQALQWLIDNELDEGKDCQLRRVIRADGGSKAWINGRPATLSQLATLGNLLVEIHGQHEHQALLDRSRQLNLLDGFGRYSEELLAVSENAKHWRQLDRDIDTLIAKGDVSERLAYLQHQHAELAREELQADSIASLLSTQRRQSNLAGLLSGCEQALTQLKGDQELAITDVLRRIIARLQQLADNEPRLVQTVEILASAQIQIDEAANSIEQFRDSMDLDPDSLNQIESRLSRLHDLARKHRIPIDQLALRYQQITDEIDALRDASGRIEILSAKRDAAQQQWQQAAKILTSKRQVAAAMLSEQVSELMNELGMAGGRFIVELESLDPSTPHLLGAERVEFLVSANPGQPPRALRKVASGGELARISLAIEVATLGLDSVPTMIFDEVDTGIGGAVAEIVGSKLRTLAANRQVMCVTHLPQVAAQGHSHYRVAKATDGHSTASMIDILDDKQRIEEIARMLGGVEISKETRANARQMLKSVDK